MLAAPCAGTVRPAAGAGASRAKLQVVRGGRKGQEFPLENGNNLVGRWDPETGAFPEVDLDADDPEAKVSRKHALIRIDSGKITIEDIGSLNGTIVQVLSRQAYHKWRKEHALGDLWSSGELGGVRF